MVKQQLIAKHIETLQMVGFVGTWQQIQKLEKEVNAFAEKRCSVYIEQNVITKKKANFIKKIKSLFDKDAEILQYIIINGDPRGYGLKIDDNYVWDLREKTDGKINIFTDLGGNGILAPNF